MNKNTKFKAVLRSQVFLVTSKRRCRAAGLENVQVGDCLGIETIIDKGLPSWKSGEFQIVNLTDLSQSLPKSAKELYNLLDAFTLIDMDSHEFKSKQEVNRYRINSTR